MVASRAPRFLRERRIFGVKGRKVIAYLGSLVSSVWKREACRLSPLLFKYQMGFLRLVLVY